MNSRAGRRTEAWKVDRAAGELTKAQVSDRCVGDQTTAGGHTGA